MNKLMKFQKTLGQNLKLRPIQLTTAVTLTMFFNENLMSAIDEMYLIMTPIFNDLFPRHRYFAILRYLHFNNTEQQEDDRLDKVNPVLRDLEETFSNSFYPYQNVCTDEGIVPFKGRLKFKQYISYVTVELDLS
jgi:hypothetical protein